MPFTHEELRNAMLLYAVTDRTWLSGRTLEADVQTVLRSGGTFLQIREKDLPMDDFLQAANALKEVAAAHHVPYVVNDSIEIALACNADGVHLGQSDLVGKNPRSLIGPDKILGVSANTVQSALAAQAAGADYLGVGAVFATSTKSDAKSLSLTQLKEICDAVTIPVVAIGGISRDNILSLKGSGIDGVAVVSALFAQDDLAAATTAMLGLAREVVGRHG